HSTISFTTHTDHRCRNLANHETRPTTTRKSNSRNHKHPALATLPRPTRPELFRVGAVFNFCHSTISNSFAFL
ncbi:MAG: hypothetical protein WCR08_13480, partial [Gammaproteobacteria bacterium]